MSTASLGHSSPPHTTAAVLEFICLFTHDLRRKQKRWQDGRLKYHSFNNRVMVYDDRGNSVGDMHWRRDYDFGEGEEVELERGGVIVQVQDLVRRTEQDLSELLDKRAKEKEQRQVHVAARLPALSASLPRTVVRPVPRDHSQPPHRPLHQIIGTPSGHRGRAVVSTDSPFEQRHQPAESPDERAAKRTKYADPPPSKSGYAQALFGQSLTLSATPVSSFPARRRPTHEPLRDSEPSSPADTSSHGVREEPKPALREQPRSSRHFNHPVERRKAARIVAESSPIHALEEDEPHVKPKQGHIASRKHGPEHDRRSSTTDQDVIEIDDPGLFKPSRPTTAGKKAPTAAKIREHATKNPVDSNLPRQTAELEAPRLGESTCQFAGRQESSRTEARLAKLKKPKLTVSEATGRKVAAAPSMQKSNPDPRIDALQRRPDEPVTELRIKSGKKRGLLMISEKHKKPSAQPACDLAASRATSEEVRLKDGNKHDSSFRSPSPQAHADPVAQDFGRQSEALIQNAGFAGLEENDNPFQSLSPPGHAGRSTRGIGQKGETSARRSISPGLGGYDDPFKSPSPSPKAQKDVVASRSVADQNENRKVTVNRRHDEDADTDLEAGLDVEPEVLDVLPDFPSDQNTACTSVPRQKVQNLSPIPSPSPEDPFGPKSKSSPKLCHAKDKSSTGTSSKMKSADHDKLMAKSRQDRKARRNVVLDDEDMDELSEGPGPAKIGIRETSDLECDDSTGKRENPKKTARSRKKDHKPRGEKAGLNTADDGLESNAEEANPRKILRANKRKARAQSKSPTPESEDEQPTKRRRSTRKTNSRASHFEETPLHSEQDDSEEEPTSKRSRRGKAPKLTKPRPRLTKIKNSVKSRELVGFDLTALHAPLGLRGIGMPFSILPPLEDEGASRRTQQHTARKEPSESTLKDGDSGTMGDTTDTLEMAAEADMIGAATSPAKAQKEHSSTVRGPSPCEQELLGANASETQAELGGGLSEATRTEPTPLLANLATPKSDTLGEISKIESSEKTTAVGDVSVAEDAMALPAPCEHRSSNDDHHINAIGCKEVTAEMTQADTGGSLSVSVTATNKPTAEISVVKNDIAPQLDFPRAGPSSAANADSAPTSVAVRPSVPPPEMPTDNSPLQGSCGTSGISEDKIPPPTKISDNSDGAGGPPAALEPCKTSLQKLVSIAERQSSTIDREGRKEVSHVGGQPGGIKTLSCEVPAPEQTLSVSGRSRDAASMESAEALAKVEKLDEVEITRTNTASTSVIQRQTSFGLRRNIPATRRINNITLNPPTTEASEAPAAGSSTKTTKLVNPASRGRKAALKSDAAGKVPQRILPLTQPSVMVPISTADLACTPLEEPPKEPVRPKKKMKFPGFQSARGEGPWSREAFDLLENGRPG